LSITTQRGHTNCLVTNASQMQPTDKISVERFDPATGKCRLAFSGRLLPQSLYGEVIAAQYECSKSQYLVFLEYKDLYDNELNIYLLDHSGLSLDAITGGGVFSAGSFVPRGCSDHVCDFVFFDETSTTRITIAPSLKLFFLLPRPWRYRNFFSGHYLSLRNINAGNTHG
jgi:hypothetical protein